MGQRLTIILALPLLGITVGCSKDAPNLPDANSYARDIKQDIHDFVNSVKGKPQEARAQGAVLLEKLEAYESRPVGDHGPIYAQLVQKGRELTQPNKSAAQVDQILRDMLDAAKKLPGEVRASPRDQ
jgi:hypothetical protein